MAKTVGVVMTEKVVAGLLENHKVVGEPKRYPEHSAAEHESDQNGSLIEMPADALAELLCEHIATLAPAGSGVEAAGIAVPGIVRNGVIEDSPNLPQLKGANIAAAVKDGLTARGLDYKISALNDADAVAAGVAATRGQLDRLVRVWTIGNGIGFGRFPYTEGPWEGGHTIITLDPKEKYCAWRSRASRRHYRPPRHAPALSGPGTGRGIRPCTQGRPALRRIRGTLALRAGSGDGFADPSRRAGTLLLHRARHLAARSTAAQGTPLSDGQDESAAELYGRGDTRGPDPGADWSGGGSGARGALVYSRA